MQKIRTCAICGAPGGWHLPDDYIPPTPQEARTNGQRLGKWSRYFCRLHYDIMLELS